MWPPRKREIRMGKRFDGNTDLMRVTLLRIMMKI